MTPSTVTTILSQPSAPSTTGGARATDTGFQTILASRHGAGARPEKISRQASIASRLGNDPDTAWHEHPAYRTSGMHACSMPGAACLAPPAHARRNHLTETQARQEDSASFVAAVHGVTQATDITVGGPFSLTTTIEEATKAFQPMKETMMSRATPPHHQADSRSGRQPLATTATNTSEHMPTGHSTPARTLTPSRGTSAPEPSMPGPASPVLRHDMTPGGTPKPGALRAVSIMQTRLESALPDPAAAPLSDFMDALDSIATRRAQTAASAKEDRDFNLAGNVTPGNALPHIGDSSRHDGAAAAAVTALHAPPPMFGPAGPVAVPGAITAGLGTSTWAPEFSRHLAALAQRTHNQSHRVELRLDPPELGPLRIALQVQDHVAHAVFVSAHASVRQAVENALPQLQEHLAQAGLALGDTSVSDHGLTDSAFSGDEAQPSPTTSPAGLRLNAAKSPLLSGAHPRTPPTSDALVDTYA